MSLRAIASVALAAVSSACARAPSAPAAPPPQPAPHASPSSTIPTETSALPEDECASLPPADALPATLRDRRAKCAEGGTVACRQIGWQIASGGGSIPLNADPSAAQFLGCACARRDAIACNGLGTLYEQGVGVRRNASRAHGLYMVACLSGVSDGCANVGVLYANGKGVERDVARAIEFYERGCNMGSADGCAGLGQFYETGEGVAKDHARAMGLAERACKGGSAVGCNNLAVDYGPGGLHPRNDAMAEELFTKACDMHYALGCYNAGRMIVRAAPSEPAPAVTLFRRGCAMNTNIGHIDCCASLAVFAARGIVDDVPRQQVQQWLAAGCKEQVPGACAALAQTSASSSEH